MTQTSTLETAPSLDDTDRAVIEAHQGGKLRTTNTRPLENAEDLSLAYTPGVALPTVMIAEDPAKARELTWRSNTVGIVTDGSAVLGLGNVGGLAGLPVMEGKAVLMHRFAGLNAVPICLDTQDTEQIITTVANLAPSFGAINLEDIAAPRCFEIEQRLDAMLDIPIFHDDQHGTAIVVHAALLGALRLTARDLAEARIVISGAGAAGAAITQLLHGAGASHIKVVDRSGVLAPSRPGIEGVKAHLAAQTNPEDSSGTLADVLENADVFIGVSGGQVPENLVASMADDAIILALANPTPEVPVEIAHRHAAVVATGRSDYPNQINNVLAFPGIFRGALDTGAATISPAMKRAAAAAIFELVRNDLRPDYIIPSAFDQRVVPAVSEAVAQAARDEGLASC